MAEIWTMGEIIVEIMRPEAGIDLDKTDFFKGPFPSGAPANFIDTVAKLGHSAGIIGGVGVDDFGKCVIGRLEKDGVDCSSVLHNPAVSTGCAFVTYFEDGSRKFIFHIGNTPAAEAKCPETLGDNMKEAKYFQIMGCSMFSNINFGREIVKTMHKFVDAGAKLSFDPNIRPEMLGDPECNELVKDVMNNVSVFQPGVQELLDITGKTDIESAVEYCFTLPKMEMVALKNGSKGCKIFTREGSSSYGIYPVEVADATGAGDSFDAAILCGLCEGLPIDETAKRANAAAALNTAAFGPMEGDISVEKVLDLMKRG